MSDVHPSSMSSNPEVYPKRESGPGSNEVTVRFGEIFPVIAQALQSGFQWVHDFEDDHVQISSDLFEAIRFVQEFGQQKS